MKYLVFGGKTGWIGQMLVEMLGTFLLNKRVNPCCVASTDIRMQNRTAVIDLLDFYKPDRVIITAGLTGRPNVDWCEDHKREVIETNVVGVLTVVDECSKRDIHVTYLGTGCIYEYDEAHPIGTRYTEQDTPNFFGSYYSKTKAMVEQLLKPYDILILRLRMPISDDLHSRSFITKILNYEKIVSVPNSMSVLPDLLPILIDMSTKAKTGIYNFVNPGAVSHNEIMEMYKELVDPEHTWTNFTLEEQAKVIKAGRSNCELDAGKLLAEYHIPSAKESIRRIFSQMSS